MRNILSHKHPLKIKINYPRSTYYVAFLFVFYTLFWVARIYQGIFNIKNIKVLAVASLLNIIFDVAVIFLFVTIMKEKKFIYLIGTILISIVNLCFTYYCELKDRMSFFLQNELLSLYREAKNDSIVTKDPCFSYNPSYNQIKPVNKSFINLISFLDKSTTQNVEEDIQNDEPMLSERESMKITSQQAKLNIKNPLISKKKPKDNFDPFKIYSKNSFCINKYFENDLNIVPNNQLIEELMNNFVSINEDLPDSIYEYISNINEYGEKFSLDKLYEVVRDYYVNEERLYTENGVQLRTSKTIVSTNKIDKELITVPGSVADRPIKNNKSYNFIKVGKIRIKLSNPDTFYKEYLVYINYVRDDIQIILEDVDELIKVEKNETIQKCRRKFISKVTSEFEDPIRSIESLLKKINEEMKTDNPMNEFIMVKNLSELLSKQVNNFKFYSKLLNEKRNDYENESSLSMNSYKGNAFMYREVIMNLMDLINTKSNIDKNKKVSIKVEIKDNLPELLEGDRDNFTMMMFNIVYNAYKNLLSGRIFIQVMMQDDTIAFQVRSDGVYMRTTVEEDNDSQSDKVMNRDNVENIFSLTEPNEANNNFYLYIAQLYSRKLGVMLNIDNSTGSMVVSFNFDFILFRNVDGKKNVLTRIDYENKKKSLQIPGSNADIKFKNTSSNTRKVEAQQNDSIITVDTAKNNDDLVFPYNEIGNVDALFTSTKETNRQIQSTISRVITQDNTRNIEDNSKMNKTENKQTNKPKRGRSAGKSRGKSENRSKNNRLISKEKRRPMAKSQEKTSNNNIRLIQMDAVSKKEPSELEKPMNIFLKTFQI